MIIYYDFFEDTFKTDFSNRLEISCLKVNHDQFSKNMHFFNVVSIPES